MKAELSYRLLVTLLFASEQQWGSVSESQSGDDRTVTFPIPFTTCYAVVSSVTNENNNSGNSFYTTGFGFKNKSKTGFTYKNPQNSVKCGKNWMAIGK